MPDLQDAPRGSTEYGLVCITASNDVRFRTVTRTSYLKLDESTRYAKLIGLYRENLTRLLGALEYCHARGIRLYRMTSQLFPLSDLDDGVGAQALADLTPELPEVARRAEAYGIRMVVHPDQFVVLSSDAPHVVRNSIQILEGHARHLDLMGLPRTPWSMILIHGGKSDRSAELTARIPDLPDNVRARLALENDEYAYGAADILAVCDAARVPFVFDVHHHVIKERLDSFEDPSVEAFVTAAQRTWPDPAWQVVHLSNGRDALHDRRHSDLIHTVPSAYRHVPWIEVEAKGKEEAITNLKRA